MQVHNPAAVYLQPGMHVTAQDIMRQDFKTSLANTSCAPTRLLLPSLQSLEQLLQDFQKMTGATPRSIAGLRYVVMPYRTYAAARLSDWPFSLWLFLCLGSSKISPPKQRAHHQLCCAKPPARARVVRRWPPAPMTSAYTAVRQYSKCMLSAPVSLQPPWSQARQ